jgi:uncharacterized membrane-anchored protein
MAPPRRSVALVALALVLQLGLVAAVAAPRLSPRLWGTEYALWVGAVDPIDPFRGAYVELGYEGFAGPGPRGDAFVRLERHSGAWRGTRGTPRRPERGPYVACRNGVRLRCGIESLFLSQEGARRLERELAEGDAVARVRIDGAGRAALLGVVPRARGRGAPAPRGGSPAAPRAPRAP